MQGRGQSPRRPRGCGERQVLTPAGDNSALRGPRRCALHPLWKALTNNVNLVSTLDILLLHYVIAQLV